MSKTGGTQLKKNLPKRAMSTKLQERRARSWTAGQARKDARRKAQDGRHRENVAAGTFSPRGATVALRPPYQYRSQADEKGGESSYERASRERFWLTLGARIRAGAAL